ncbi:MULTISPECIES: phosphogluconate dehydrogenase (NAD(+)-dependent, decarboxylating) [unclassified Fusibacter]|uniref:phosphogluconate dehydrogenase (NAD(+)-dependent, decarboxylating) n=1 Tax=unclassified Fusibacter TaxID=2624464 RepID=UPI001012492A|nr:MULTISPECIES: decarboxylating 6-phosphogluconate dehydrogenase [unclassified Fusibacter]MCK8060494.1 decarboxylating 6-phosphogluconate dehydrogenase [Fusibacter sp. A2]NPE20217.1 decarboxylating 6-phosphogluconate dehydrogenase [Fusibacter sp. A1]RXV63426.1 decarboxylating 6-phosphogluconate dehydrogenase [Fusibacter sp. A1]
MKIGMIGLGKMGGNLAWNMRDHGVDVVVYNRSKAKTEEFIKEGFEGAYFLPELCEKLGQNAVYWLMIPAGEVVDEMIDQIMEIALPGSLIVDGGNSNFKDTVRRAKRVLDKGFRYMDIGTSGGQQGAREGACMMVGGEEKDYIEIAPLLVAVCVDDGVNYMGKHGTGHYVKMIHNGVEYGMMQAIAEGFEILEGSDFDLDLKKIAKVWQNGSIVSSYLVDKTVDALEKNPSLDGILDVVDSSGEGLWTVEEALRQKLPAYVITTSLFKRFESKQDDRFSNKLLAAMRNEFGGHKLHTSGK